MKNLPPLSPDLSPQAAAEFAEIRRIMREAEEERKVKVMPPARNWKTMLPMLW